jgi:hypothetical protein
MLLITPIKQAGTGIRSRSETVAATARDRVIEPVRSKLEDGRPERVTRKLPVIAAGGAAIVATYAVVKRSLNGRAEEPGDGHREPSRSEAAKPTSK